jgi:GNAT superfamily N-acetyltransferase
MLAATLHDTLDSIPQLDPLVELLRAQLLEEGQDKSREEVRSSLAHAFQPGSRAKLIILSEAHTAEPVGFAFFNVGSGLESGGDYIWLNEIHIAAKFRGQGEGRRMMDFLSDWARHNRIKGIYGVCGMKNGAARSFYRRMGFTTDQVCWFAKLLG